MLTSFFHRHSPQRFLGYRCWQSGWCRVSHSYWEGRGRRSWGKLINYYVPCKKCHMDTHGNSMTFYVTTQLNGSLIQIDTKVHDYSMSFISRFCLFSMLKHDMDFGFWTSSSYGISMAFAKKMVGFPTDLVSFLNFERI